MRRFRPNLLPPLVYGERAIFWLVAVLLTLGALAYLGASVAAALKDYLGGDATEATLELLNGTLLTLMLAQIVYTTLNFLETGILEIEPVLVVGIIAAVRRILVVTATLSAHGESNELAFRQAMVELGSLGGVTLVLAVAVFLIRFRKGGS